VGQWAPRLNDYLLTPRTPTCSAKSSPRSCVFLVTRFMDCDQIKKEKRKAVWGGVGEGLAKGKRRRQLPCWNLLTLLVSGKRTVLFQSCLTPSFLPSFTQRIEKGYVWPAMIEGNVGTPQTKSKTGFTHLLTSVCWLLGCF
jgi:hypothetical protein